MTNKRSPDDTQLSDAIRSLQNLLDDVRTDPDITDTDLKSSKPERKIPLSSLMEQTDEFPAMQDEPEETDEPVLDEPVLDDTTEFTLGDDTATMKALSARKDSFDIDSHFDMNIPPALPDDDQEEELEHNIPTLSETIVNGDIPVLKEIVKLPDGSMIPEPEDIDLETAIQSGKVPTPVNDAAEAAADAVRIILARYHSKPMTPELREQLKAIIVEFLSNAAELEIPASIID